jgi:putative copper export protein
VVPVTADAIRLFLHVLAATVWVGGQLVLGALVPAVRPAGPEAVSAVARRFQQLAWPAFAVLLLTGLWNLDAAEYSKQTDEWQATVMAKIGAFVIAGVTAAGHTALGRRAGRVAGTPEARKWRARAGASAGIALLASLAALFWGVSLRA